MRTLNNNRECSQHTAFPLKDISYTNGLAWPGSRLSCFSGGVFFSQTQNRINTHNTAIIIVHSWECSPYPSPKCVCDGTTTTAIICRLFGMPTHQLSQENTLPGYRAWVKSLRDKCHAWYTPPLPPVMLTEGYHFRRHIFPKCPGSLLNRGFIVRRVRLSRDIGKACLWHTINTHNASGVLACHTEVMACLYIFKFGHGWLHSPHTHTMS